MNQNKLDRAVSLLVFECLASFEYTLGRNCEIFTPGLRGAIDTTLMNYEYGHQLVNKILEALGEYESDVISIGYNVKE